MRFSPEIWVQVLQDIIEGDYDILEGMTDEEEDLRDAILHEIEVLEDMLERAYLLQRVLVTQIH